MAFEQVSNPQQFALRPLDGGMVLNKASQNLKPNQCVDAKNLIITENGPRRRPGYGLYGGVTDTYETMTRTGYRHIDLLNFWTSEVGELEQQMLLLTAGPMYRVGFGGLEEVSWYYNAGTVTVAATFVTGVGTAFITNNILPGDILRVGAEEARVKEILSETTLTLQTQSISDGTGLVYTIAKSFNTEDKFLVDWVVHNNEVILTDFNRPLQVYRYDQPDNSQIGDFITDADNMIDSGSGPEEFVAACVAVFQDRLFVGNTLEPTDGLRRHRVRWSSATNVRDFSGSTAWIDLPYTQGAIRRMLPLGDTLIVYFDDAIFVGIPTNNPNLPVAFKMVETSSVGIIGSKAVARFLDGHFFIGQDDIYLMTSRGPERIGSAVVSSTIKTSNYRERCYAAVDPENDRIVFGFTRDRAIMERLWSFQYKTGGWSYAAYDTYMIANPLSAFELTWEDLTGFTWSEAGDIGSVFPTWDSMVIRENTIPFYTEESGAIRKLSQNAAYDIITSEDGNAERQAIDMAYETGDFDFDDPDGNKTFTRLSMKVDFSETPAEDIPFVVQGSWNRGRNWDNLGTLWIREGYDEGYVNFLITSSHVRFRISNSSMIPPFTITEFVLKARARGKELNVQAQTP